jgi:hypothetical protein
VNGSAPSSDEDNFALGGLQALEEAERQDREDAQRRASLQSGLLPVERPTHPHPQQYAEASSSDGPGVDLGSFGGGFAGPVMTHLPSPNQLAVARNESLSALHGRQGSQTMSSSGSRRSRTTSDNNTYPYAQPQVDVFDTGGLVDSTRPRRLSYDEGAEEELEAATGYEFFHPGIGNRPLPPPPAPYQSQSQNNVPTASDWTGDTVPFPRNHSMVMHSGTPLPYAPVRSATDADEKKKKPQRRSMIGIDSAGEDSAGAMMLDLPSVTKRFNPSKLSSRDFNKCTEPWALSAVTTWLRRLVSDEQYLKKQPLVEALVALFTHKVANMNIADAETLAGSIIDEMHSNGTLYDEEEWLFFSETPLVGVIFQLTGSGCYSPKLHEYDTPGRCYAHHCQRTEKKIDLSSESVAPKASWVEFYNISIDDVAKYDKKEVERQNILHEMVQTEENYVRNLTVLQTLYRDELAQANPPLIPPKTLPSFLKDVFGKLDAVKKANEEYLLPQIKYRQKEQGPWIVGFSDIFRDWIRKARVAYIDYASAYPNAIFRVKQEMERNVLFKTFLNKCLQDERAARLDYNHYMKAPIGRLQSLVLLLETALRKSVNDNEEKKTLQSAIEEIRKVTFECDTRVGDGTRKVELSSLQSRFQFKGNLPRVDLNLDHLGRELLHQGELVRIGGTRFTLVESYCFLFDHFFVLAKQENIKSADGVVKSDQYDITRMPIPMDLLVLESRDDELVVRAALAGVRVAAANNDRPKQTTKDSAPGLNHSSTSTSLASSATGKGAPPAVANAEPNDKTMYPFKIRHLGRETYTLYAQSSQSREDWCNKIIEAKTKHAHALFAQNAEPFKLKVIADTAFAYDGAASAQAGIAIKGTPLDRAVQEVTALYANYGRPAPVCRARVNCATSFLAGSKEMVAVGTDYGVYIAQTGDPRGWQKVIPNQKVTQIAVIEDFQLFILISDKSLMAYHLDVVCPPNGVTPSNDSTRAAPHKISGNKDVGFFSIARMKDRTLLFYKKGSVSSTFKVITVRLPAQQPLTPLT